MIICVDGDVVFAQIAGVAKVFLFAYGQVYFDGPLFGLHFFAQAGGIELYWPAVFVDKHIGDFAVEFFFIEFCA